MNAAPGDDRWYAVSTGELATTLAQADNRVRMAREGLDLVHRDMAGTIVALADLEIEVRKRERIERPPFELQATYEGLRQSSEHAVRDADDVRQHLGHAQGALAAGHTLLAGMPTPGTDQDRLDQEALRARLNHVHRTVSEAIPMAEQVRDRMRATSSLAAHGRDRTAGPPSREVVDDLTQDLALSRAMTRQMDRPVQTAGLDASRAVAQADALASTARLRAGQQSSTLPAAAVTPPPGVQR